MNNPFQPVAQALQQAAEQLALEQAQSQQAQQDPQASMQASQVSEGGGTTQVPTLVELELRLERMAHRDWGRLPGELETEILQASQRRMDGEYGELIREYFRELSNQQVNEIP
jgi:type III secretory pathway component EscV